jgi:hypothetical protein
MASRIQPIHDFWESLARWERRLAVIAGALLAFAAIFYTPALVFNAGPAFYRGNIYQIRIAGLSAGKTALIVAAVALLAVVCSQLRSRSGKVRIVTACAVLAVGGASVLAVRLHEGHGPAQESALLRPGASYVNPGDIGSYRILPLGAPLSAGKWYWEVRSGNLGCCDGGVAATASFGVTRPGYQPDRELGSYVGSWAWRGDGTRAQGGARQALGSAARGDDTVAMVALDLDAGKIWFGVNGKWLGGGDPARGIDPAFGGLKGPLVPALSSQHAAKGTAVLYAATAATLWRYPPPQGFSPPAVQ